MKPTISLLFLLLLHYSLTSQCGIGVDAGNDITVCFPGDLVSLQGEVFGNNVVDFFWSPSANLSDPGSLNPTVFVDNTTIFTLTAQVFDPSNNLIFNGDFSAGATGFTSEYVPGTGGAFGVLSNEGEYATTTNSNLVHSNFASCGDHTGGGQMLVVNGSTTANESIWCQVVSVTPNTDHLFSSWLQSVISENPAVLQFSINGQLLGGTFSAPFASCNWQQFTETWNSGAATTAEICILNQNTQVSGNDFAIDDIFFGPVCEQSDEMIVEVIEVIAVVLDPDVQACTGNSLVTLDGSFSSAGPNIFYEWTTTNGNIVGPTTTPVIEVDEPGTYTLTVSYFNGSFQCSDVVTVVVPPT
ncbi:MAG: hypothetical protein AAFU67_13240, partial [Bacteroidota bacterium]